MRILTMTTAVMFALGVANAAQDASSIGSESHALLWTTVAGFLSLLATQGFAMWREYRNRKWDLQDRAAAREELRQNVRLQKIETISTAVQLAQVARTHQNALSEQLAENTALTKQVGEKAEAAYEAGNNFNQKIEALRTKLESFAQKGQIEKGQIDHIEQVSEDTNVKVTEIKKEVSEKEGSL